MRARSNGEVNPVAPQETTPSGDEINAGQIANRTLRIFDSICKITSIDGMMVFDHAEFYPDAK
jgi:hypothetical protein